MTGNPEAIRRTAKDGQFSERSGHGTVSGRKRGVNDTGHAVDRPLIVALHGGTYSSAYFDVPGYSLIDRAAALGLPIIALDRPGYGETTPLAPHDATIAGNAERLDSILGDIWERHGSGYSGIFLIGHSIGGAITVSIAARRPAWPLVGIAVSGVGLVTPPESLDHWSALPQIPMINLPRAGERSGHVRPRMDFLERHARSQPLLRCAGAPCRVDRHRVDVACVGDRHREPRRGACPLSAR